MNVSFEVEIGDNITNTTWIQVVEFRIEEDEVIEMLLEMVSEFKEITEVRRIHFKSSDCLKV